MGLLAKLIAASVFVVIAWYLYRAGNVSMPDSLSRHDQQRVLTFSIIRQVLHDIQSALSWVGLPNTSPFSRGLINSIIRLAAYFEADRSSVEESEIHVDGIAVSVYRPAGMTKRRLPAIVYFHGGGWVAYDRNIVAGTLFELVRQAKVAVFNVEYRLAPQFPFPTPLNDCTAVTEHVLAHAKELRIDASRVAVGGDSAGGNMAAVIAHRLRDRLKAQILVYPAVQTITFNTPSYQNTVLNNFCTRDFVIHCLQHYIGAEQAHIDHYTGRCVRDWHLPKAVRGNRQHKKLLDESAWEGYATEQQLVLPEQTSDPSGIYAEFANRVLEPEVAPLLQPDFNNIPKAYVLTAQHDVLRDDSLLYIKRLKQANVPVQHAHYKSGFHGFFSFVRLQLTNTAIRDLAAYLINEL